MQALKNIVQNKDSITIAKLIASKYRDVALIDKSRALFAELPRSLQNASLELIKSRHGVWLFCEQVETAINAIDDDSYSYLLRNKLFNYTPLKAHIVAERLGVKKECLCSYSNRVLLSFYAEYLKVVAEN